MDPQENSHPSEKPTEPSAESDSEYSSDPVKEEFPINQKFSLENLEGWKHRFSTLPDLSAQEALAKIEAGEVVKDVKISEPLNLDRKDLENLVRFEGCSLFQVSARGSHLQGGLEMNHCMVSGEVHLSGKKEGEESHNTILSSLKLEGSVFEGEFLFHYGEVRGEVSGDHPDFHCSLLPLSCGDHRWPGKTPKDHLYPHGTPYECDCLCLYGLWKCGARYKPLAQIRLFSGGTAGYLSNYSFCGHHFEENYSDLTLNIPGGLFSQKYNPPGVLPTGIKAGSPKYRNSPK